MSCACDAVAGGGGGGGGTNVDLIVPAVGAGGGEGGRKPSARLIVQGSK